MSTALSAMDTIIERIEKEASDEARRDLLRSICWLLLPLVGAVLSYVFLSGNVAAAAIMICVVIAFGNLLSIETSTPAAEYVLEDADILRLAGLEFHSDKASAYLSELLQRDGALNLGELRHARALEDHAIERLSNLKQPGARAFLTKHPLPDTEAAAA